ncbi:MAG TPA: NAD(P)/FAD-dependent oxidoreductase [Chloroflexota bacterium]|nr:NAD(P)/FAD-dependent oxidoreductase [Chloroflexota bacterium]
MARTPLMNWVMRIAREHQEAGDQRERAELEISRRNFLAAAGAGAATLAVLGPDAVVRAASAPRIGIIGGGIAGLTAALTLQDAGYASTVFESSNRLGGRMHSLESGFWQNGQTSEWCGELIDTGHKLILHLAQRFNLSTVDMVQAQPSGSQDTYYVHGQYYTYAQATSDFKPVHNTLQGQVQQAPFPTLYNQYTSYGQYLDSISVYQWIEQFVPGGHASNLGALLDSAYNQEYGLDTTVQSSLNIVYLLGYQASPGEFSIYGLSDERYHILGGNQQLPAAITSQVQTGAPNCTIQMQWKMTKIVTNSDGSITCTFATPKGNQAQTFDRVILAIPFSVLRTLDYSKAGFDNLKQTAITQLGYGTNTKFNLQFSSRYWNSTGPWPGVSDGNIYTDLPFENAWDATRGQSGSTGILVLFTGGSNGAAITAASPYETTTGSSDANQWVQPYLNQLETVWPGAHANYTGLAAISTPWQDPNLLGSYSCWKVGQYVGFSGYERVRQGKTHFAGEHCSINFQGYMEGGAEEGQRAANEILSDYKAGIFP